MRTGQAILIDPVLPAMSRDLAELNRLGLKLAYTSAC
jgi:sulfur dioxygenase